MRAQDETVGIEQDHGVLRMRQAGTEQTPAEQTRPGDNTEAHADLWL
jgi:hypothetical protein